MNRGQLGLSFAQHVASRHALMRQRQRPRPGPARRAQSKRCRSKHHMMPPCCAVPRRPRSTCGSREPCTSAPGAALQMPSALLHVYIIRGATMGDDVAFKITRNARRSAAVSAAARRAGASLKSSPITS